MARAHALLQSGEQIYVDVVSSLDVCNLPVMVFSAAHVSGHIPLGIIVMSTESEKSMDEAITIFKNTLPENAFGGNGGQSGPKMFLTDDSAAERAALGNHWPNSKYFLCVWHLLAAVWTWLWKRVNNIEDSDRLTIIAQFKKIVYASSEEKASGLYSSLEQKMFEKYPKLKQHLDRLWNRRREWALCFRRNLMTRGNYTNNYAESLMRVIKDIVFKRKKALTELELFRLFTREFELYFKRRLLTVCGLRRDVHVADRFFMPRINSINDSCISKDSSQSNVFYVQMPDELYIVNTALGTCTCSIGVSGAACIHQAATAYKYKVSCINLMPTESIQDRLTIARVALGDAVDRLPSGYFASVHQQEIDLNTIDPPQEQPITDMNTFQTNSLPQNEPKDIVHLISDLDQVISDLKLRIKQDPNNRLTDAAQFFIDKYKLILSNTSSHPSTKLADLLYSSGDTYVKKNTRNKKIHVQARSIARRASNIASRQACKAGRPKIVSPITKAGTKKRRMLNQHSFQPKRRHKLSDNIAQNVMPGGLKKGK